jgi:hypothetical protein
MAQYVWSARSTAGNVLSGTIDAGSKEEVIEGLRAKGMAVLSVDAASDVVVSRVHGTLPNTGFVAALIRVGLAGLLAGGAYAMYSIAKQSTIRCVHDSTGKTYDCEIVATADISAAPLQNRLIGASSATSEEQTSESRGFDRQTKRPTTSSSTRTRIVITAEGPGVTTPGTIATPWMYYPFPSSAHVAQRLDTYFKSSGEAPFRSWEIEIAPVGVAVVASLGAVVALLSGLRRAFMRSA